MNSELVLDSFSLGGKLSCLAPLSPLSASDCKWNFTVRIMLFKVPEKWRLDLAFLNYLSSCQHFLFSLSHTVVIKLHALIILNSKSFSILSSSSIYIADGGHLTCWSNLLHATIFWDVDTLSLSSFIVSSLSRHISGILIIFILKINIYFPVLMGQLWYTKPQTVP